MRKWAWVPSWRDSCIVSASVKSLHFQSEWLLKQNDNIYNPISRQSAHHTGTGCSPPPHQLKINASLTRYLSVHLSFPDLWNKAFAKHMTLHIDSVRTTTFLKIFFSHSWNKRRLRNYSPNSPFSTPKFGPCCYGCRCLLFFQWFVAQIISWFCLMEAEKNLLQIKIFLWLLAY